MRKHNFYSKVMRHARWMHHTSKSTQLDLLPPYYPCFQTSATYEHFHFWTPFGPLKYVGFNGNAYCKN